MPEEIEETIKIIKHHKNLNLEGLCSHLADADGESEEFTKKQIIVWNKTVEKFQTEFGKIKYLHLANTAGNYFSGEAITNVSRLGIGLFGFNTSHNKDLDLKPVLEMVTKIATVRKVPAGEKVGYNITYETNKETILATIPVGYNEGVDRRLSNTGFVKIKNIFCPIVGRVSMNMCSVDVSEVKNLKYGDEVVVISKNSEDKNSVENISKFCETIAYEILVHIPQSLRRVVL